MIRRRVLSFFAVFALFGAVVAVLHLIFLVSVSFSSPVTGAVISSSSPLFVSSVALFLLVVALVFFILALKRVIPTNIRNRIAFHPSALR